MKVSDKCLFLVLLAILCFFFFFFFSGLAMDPSPSGESMDPSPSGEIEGFKSLTLSLRWWITACKILRCAQSARPEFVLHTLWPEVQKSALARTQGPNALTDGIILKHEADLNRVWPNLMAEKMDFNISFYEEKYKETGLKCNKIIPADEFFTLTIKLAKEYPQMIYELLQTHGFEPNDDAKISPRKFYDTIKRKIGQDPEIGCKKYGKKREVYIYEVRICFNPTGERIVNCRENRFCRAYEYAIFPESVITKKKD